MQRYGGTSGRGRRIIGEDTPLSDPPLETAVTKGWGADLTRASANAARKTKIRQNIKDSRETRLSPDRDLIRQIQGENDFDRHSNRKAINFVERFRHDPETGTRRLARPGVPTSPPRGRSLTSSDRSYLGLSSGGQSATRQGVGGRRGDTVAYQFTGNSRVRKARYYDPEHRRQRRLGAAEAGLLAAGGLAIGHGTQGAVKSTRALRALKIRSGGKTPSDIPVSRTKVGRLSAAASPRELGYIGGGTAAVTAAGEVHRQSGNKGRLRAWK